MKKTRKHYTAEEKVAILRRHLVDKESVSKLCDELALQPTVFYRWQKEFFENGAAAFQTKNRSRRVLGRARKVTSAPVIIVSMSPPGYPSAGLLPSRARFRFTRQCHCNSKSQTACRRRSCRCSRACSSLRSRAAWISFWRPASMSSGVTNPIALCKRTVL